MNDYKYILIGNNIIASDWIKPLNSINKKHIIICDFNDKEKLNKITSNNNIIYAIPLSDVDCHLINIYIDFNKLNIQILYPTKDVFELLHNKNLFTDFMLKNYIDSIPDIYYLDNTKLKDIEYPAIYKPKYSSNGSDMIIIHNDNDLINLKNYNNIQQFIDYEYEYGAYMLCINGRIINHKIIRHKFEKYHIKKSISLKVMKIL
jgi:hypothetical protein